MTSNLTKCHFPSSFRYTGTPVLTSWGKQWSVTMEAAYVMDPPLRTASTMTCTWMSRRKQSTITLKPELY